MCIRRVVILLLLAGISCSAHGACDAQNNTLPTSDVDKALGVWALVWAVSDHAESIEYIQNLTSSNVELKFHDDNHTIHYDEYNFFSDGACKMYKANITVISNPQDALTMRVVSAVEEIAGVQTVYNDSAEVSVYKSCPYCLMMMYKSQRGPRYLMGYRAMGKHTDLSEVKVSEEEGLQLIKCLDFNVVTSYKYTGAEEFCHGTKPGDGQAS